MPRKESLGQGDQMPEKPSNPISAAEQIALDYQQRINNQQKRFNRRVLLKGVTALGVLLAAGAGAYTVVTDLSGGGNLPSVPAAPDSGPVGPSVSAVSTPTETPLPTGIPTVNAINADNGSAPACDSAKGKVTLTQVRQFENDPNIGWGIAGDVASLTLIEPDLCSDDRIVLAREAALAGLETIYEPKYPPYFFHEQQEQAVKEYTEWKKMVNRFNLPPDNLPSHWLIAKRAYAVDKFLLAKLVLDEAALNGELKFLDNLGIHFVYATLRNLGWWYTREKIEPYYTQGLQNLAAAAELTRRYGVGGEAHQDLSELLGKDEKNWPVPVNEPLLIPGVLPDFKITQQ